MFNMKLFYVILTAFVVCKWTTEATHVKHRLLLPPNNIVNVNESFTPGEHSYEFTSGKAIKVGLNETDLVGLEFTKPFIVTAIFKSYSESAGPFRIRTGDAYPRRQVVVGLTSNFYKNKTKIYLLTDRYTTFSTQETLKDKWMKLVVYARANGTSELHVNCKEIYRPQYKYYNTARNSVIMTTNMTIELAYQFKGLIEEISLYTNADDDSMKQICAENKEFQNTTSVLGPAGQIGPPGMPGLKGDKGDSGSKGEQGLIGPAGPPGIYGIKGESGPMGFIGQKGLMGPVGPVGPPGLKGEKGNVGYSGVMGSEGPVGPPGMQGVKGEPGVQGYQGNKGDTGSPGLRGHSGENGLPGLPGSKGEHGRTGEKGDKGDPGYNGMPGLPGRDGLPASLTSLLDDENEAVVEKLRGLKGETGMNGEKGTKGDRGETGEPGAVGFKGETGMKGPNGFIGPQGLPGLRGVPGYKGKSGQDGVMGVKGEKGDNGNIPEIDLYKLKGDKGHKGLTGNPGQPGAVGPQGPPGICVVDPVGSPEQPKNSRTDEKYTLLHPPNGTDLVNDSYTSGLRSYKFTNGEPVEVDPKVTNLVGVKLSPPFIVTATFKSFTDKPSCLFSIKQDDDSVISLCLTSVANISRATLFTDLYSPPNSISYLYNGNFKDKWAKIVIYVKDDKADLYLNCKKYQHVEEQPALERNKDVLLTKDMELTLAPTTPSGFIFEGLIEEINLYTNANDDTLLHLCNENSNFSSNFDKHGQEYEKQTQSLKYDYKKDLAECHREITVIKDDMNGQIKNITNLIRNEVKEDIEELQIQNEYLKEELIFLRNQNMDIENELNELKNINIDIENELNKLKSQIQILATGPSTQTPS